MKVKELIEILKKQPQDAPVNIEDADLYWNVNHCGLSKDGSVRVSSKPINNL